jgi:cobalt-zinc-cadmium efflux system outer membrane protein
MVGMIRSLCMAAVPLLLSWGTGLCSANGRLSATPGNLWSTALEHSDELTASSLIAESASSLYSASGRLPDPSLRIGWAPSALETRNGPVEFSATLMQKIPWPGVLARSRDRMGYMEDLAAIDHLLNSLEMRTTITVVWAEMYLARSSILWLTDELERLDHLTAIADIRYRSGQVDLSALLVLENRTVLVESRIYGLQLTLEAGELEMASLVGLPGTEFSWPDTVPDTGFFQKGFAIPADIEETPLVQRSITERESSRAAAAVSRGGLYPDLEFGATWSRVGEPDVEMGAVDPGGDALMIFAGLSLPLGYSGTRDRSSAARLSSEAAEYRLTQVISDQAARRQRLVNELEGMIYMHGSYRETVLPNLEAIYELTVTKWITGLSDIGELIENLSNLEEARLEEHRIYSGIVVTYAEVMELDGRDTEKGEFL